MIMDSLLQIPGVALNLEDKIGFLASLGSVFPKLFDASFGVVLDRLELLVGNFFLSVCMAEIR